MRRQLFLALLLALALPTISPAMDVHARRDPGFEVASYKTYVWRLPERPEDHPLTPGSELDLLIRSSCDELLAKKGYELVDGDQADLVITYEGVVEPKYEATGVHEKLGPATWIGVPESETLRIYQQGLLAITVLDGEDDDELWAGWATAISKNPSREKMRKRATTAVRKILAHLPAH